MADFQARIAKYEEVYQTLTDRNLHYIKLIDMCALLCGHSSCPVYWAGHACVVVILLVSDTPESTRLGIAG